MEEDLTQNRAQDTLQEVDLELSFGGFALMERWECFVMHAS